MEERHNSKVSGFKPFFLFHLVMKTIVGWYTIFKTYLLVVKVSDYESEFNFVEERHKMNGFVICFLNVNIFCHFIIIYISYNTERRHTMRKIKRNIYFFYGRTTYLENSFYNFL